MKHAGNIAQALTDAMRKHVKHYDVTCIASQTFSDTTPTWWARFEIRDKISGATMTVEGPGVNGKTWGGDVSAFSFVNPLDAWEYALQNNREVTL